MSYDKKFRKRTIEYRKEGHTIEQTTKTFEREVKKSFFGGFQAITFEKGISNNNDFGSGNSSYKIKLKGKMSEHPYEVYTSDEGSSGIYDITTGVVTFRVEIVAHYVKLIVELDMPPYKAVLFDNGNHNEQVAGEIAVKPYAILYISRNHTTELQFFNSNVMYAIASTYHHVFKYDLGLSYPQTAEELLFGLNTLYDSFIITEAEQKQALVAVGIKY